jgi:hypothetical protein
LAPEANAAQLELYAQRLFVDRLQKTRTKNPVHFNRGADGPLR